MGLGGLCFLVNAFAHIPFTVRVVGGYRSVVGLFRKVLYQGICFGVYDFYYGLRIVGVCVVVLCVP